jgi:hypothetical protein
VKNINVNDSQNLDFATSQKRAITPKWVMGFTYKLQGM